MKTVSKTESKEHELTNLTTLHMSSSSTSVHSSPVSTTERRRYLDLHTHVFSHQLHSHSTSSTFLPLEFSQ